MTITLELPPHEETQVLEKARLLGISAEDYLRTLLARVLAAEERVFDVAAALRPVSEEQKERISTMFQSFRDGDAEEQGETLTYLTRVLDEDRLSNRPLFPSKQP